MSLISGTNHYTLSAWPAVPKDKILNSKLILRVVSAMMDKTTKKRMKKIKKEMDLLRKKLRKIEIRPCHGDADLKQKEMEIRSIKDKLLDLEREHDRYMLNTGKIKHGSS